MSGLFCRLRNGSDWDIKLNETWLMKYNVYQPNAPRWSFFKKKNLSRRKIKASLYLRTGIQCSGCVQRCTLCRLALIQNRNYHKLLFQNNTLTIIIILNLNDDIYGRLYLVHVTKKTPSWDSIILFYFIFFFLFFIIYYHRPIQCD